MKADILFIYRNQNEKKVISFCQEALKVVFRKFRKSVSYSLLQLDLSPSCKATMTELLQSKISEHSCIIFLGQHKDCFQEEQLFKEYFKAYAKLYFSSGKCICSPLDTITAEKGESFLQQSICTDASALYNTASLASFCT